MKKLIFIIGLLLTFLTQIASANDFEKHAVRIVSISPIVSRCSGVLIDETATTTHILTAKHCVSTEEQYIIIEDTIRSAFVFASSTDDLALIIIKDKIENKEPVTLNTENIRLGDNVNSLGYPYWDKSSFVSDGIVVRQSDEMVWTHFKSIGGCSGAGIFNNNAELVGILRGGVNSEDISVFEPNKDILTFLNKTYKKLK